MNINVDNNKRNSAVEILRILAMVFIILSHYSVHGGVSSTELISTDFGNAVILQIVQLGNLGVDIFVLLTGYFMVTAVFKVEKVIKLILQVWIYSVSIFVVLFATGSIDFSLKVFIESRPDMELVEVYGDHGASGLRMEERPEFQRMIKDAMDGKIDVIYTKSVSRFARNARECEQVLEQLCAKGVCVIFEEQNIKSTDSQFSLVLKLLESIAQEQSNSQSQSILWSVDNNAALGRPAYKCCFGYVKENVEDKTLTERERHTWSVNEEEAVMVRTMFDMIESGESTYDVARRMNEMEAERGGSIEWKSCKIPWMLRNIAYKGDILTHKTVVKDYISGKAVKNEGYREQYYLKGHHPAIIGEEQFENVQKILASRSKKWKEKRS